MKPLYKYYFIEDNRTTKPSSNFKTMIYSLKDIEKGAPLDYLEDLNGKRQACKSTWSIVDRVRNIGFKDRYNRTIFEKDILVTEFNFGKGVNQWKRTKYGITIPVIKYNNSLGLRLTYSNWKIESKNMRSVFREEFISIIGNTIENPRY